MNNGNTQYLASQGTVSNLKILHFNCRGIRNKKIEFFEYLIENDIAILV